MLFIDDGSTDDTLLKLKDAMQQFPALRVLQHQKSCGQSRAVHTGVSAAQYDWIATLDGDGQNDPADIPNMIETLQNQHSDQLWMLAGHRHLRNDTGWRRFSSKFANAIRQAILHDQTPDSGCGLKLFRRDKFLALPYFDHIHRYLPALMLREGYEVAFEPVNHRHRETGVSKYNNWGRLKASVSDLLGVMWLNTRARNPLGVDEV